MPIKLKNKSALLLSVLLLTACATSQPPLTVRIPSPPAELMTIHETPLSENVPALFQRWTRMLENWLGRLQVCKDLPQTCV